MSKGVNSRKFPKLTPQDYGLFPLSFYFNGKSSLLGSNSIGMLRKEGQLLLCVLLCVFE